MTYEDFHCKSFVNGYILHCNYLDKFEPHVMQWSCFKAGLLCIYPNTKCISQKSRKDEKGQNIDCCSKTINKCTR